MNDSTTTMTTQPIIRPRIGQRRVAPGLGIVTLVERQCRVGEGPIYVIGIPDPAVDGGYRRMEARAAATVARWPLARC